MNGLLITLIIICSIAITFSICYHFLSCGHDWEVVDKLEKEVVITEKGYSWDPTITKNYHKHILLLKCKKCGKIKKEELV